MTLTLTYIKKELATKIFFLEMIWLKVFSLVFKISTSSNMVYLIPVPSSTYFFALCAIFVAWRVSGRKYNHVLWPWMKMYMCKNCGQLKALKILVCKTSSTSWLVDPSCTDTETVLMYDILFWSLVNIMIKTRMIKVGLPMLLL